MDLFYHTSGAGVQYGGNSLEVMKVTAVYNKILVSNFINSYKIMIHRYVPPHHPVFKFKLVLPTNVPTFK